MLNSETDSLLASVERQNHHSDFFDDELSSDSDNETLRTSNVTFLYYQTLLILFRKPYLTLLLTLQLKTSL